MRNASITPAAPNAGRLLRSRARRESPGVPDGRAADARFNIPIGIAISHDGVLLVADGAFDDNRGNSTIRRITPSGLVTTIAGLAGAAGSVDGPSGDARFRYPVGIAADRTGTIFMADTGNSTIRAISPAGLVTTLGE